jgi:hypothetical protein
MEGLRIRIPRVFHCFVDGCKEYTRNPGLVCRTCRTEMLLARVSEEVAAAALAREAQFVHSTPLRRHLSG